MNLNEIKKNIRLVGMVWFSLAYLIIVIMGGSMFWDIAASILLILGGIAEWIAIEEGQSITEWYIPKLPARIDKPLSVVLPTILVVKCVWMVNSGQIITCYWAGSAIVLAWIIGHLCSFENKR